MDAVGHVGRALATCVSLYLVLAAAKQPHIVFIVADDLGYSDVGFHNPEMQTPNIDQLANGGVIMEQAYTQPLCSPTRSALMTGLYPFRTGLQHLVILDGTPVCAPLNNTLLPEELKNLGYSTHMVGKWHLGFCSEDCLPTRRGFDTFFGYLGSDEDHWNHTQSGYLDLRDNEEPATEYNGNYSSYLFGDKASDAIMDHDTSTPLFLYAAFQNVHWPLQVPESYKDRFPYMANEGRKTVAAMAAALDDSVGKLIEALKWKDMYDDTIILFLADNGGSLPFYGRNYPLRGGKETVYEGGTRTICFMTGPGLENTAHHYQGLIHAVDWKATLVGAAGGDLDVSNLDSIDHWADIVDNQPTKRHEIVYNLDPLNYGYDDGYAAIRVGDYKLIHGYPGMFDGWVKPETTPEDATIKKTPRVNNPLSMYQLFNLKVDPYETKNLYATHRSIADRLEARLEDYWMGAIEPKDPPVSPASDPANFGNVWSPGWCVEPV